MISEEFASVRHVAEHHRILSLALATVIARSDEVPARIGGFGHGSTHLE
jgi:hypothetical protein